MAQDIFNGIQVEHVVAAILEIDRNGVRKGRRDTPYDLVYNNKLYSPTYVLSLAARHATGEELDSDGFDEGVKANAVQLLKDLNFQLDIATKIGAPLSFWWVNHKQTGKIEVDEGYIWSPKRKNNGSDNQTYINLTKTTLGDIIFSYVGGEIIAVGKVIAMVQDAERPADFGKVGHQWDEKGWLVGVEWQRLLNPLVPKKHLIEIVQLLPTKHSPIQANGNGNQGVYLAEIGIDLGSKLLSLIEIDNYGIGEVIHDIDTRLKERLQERDIENAPIPVTQKRQLVLSRVGQGLFRMNVQKIESKCRVTGLSDKRLLIASHIKPWRVSSNKERLDGNNGLLLSPHIDKLFDKGWISFSEEGGLLVCKNKIRPILNTWSIDANMFVGTFTYQQKAYLEYHRAEIFKG
ncbi:HNH endonuclease [uncultured Chitinophaga sp.]|uniref:HNH endonuclease n=1 Tax=uncultured Chitinophaga sp. TaxID=339340 RepID=UPI0025E04832|nr:HNH endonuclease [uncultured Chitinophaga sp.]